MVYENISTDSIKKFYETLTSRNIVNNFAKDIAMQLYTALQILQPILSNNATEDKAKQFGDFAKRTVFDFFADKVADSTKKVDISTAFTAYLNSVFVDKSRFPDYIHWEGIEKTGEYKGQECYYFDQKYLYRDFIDFCKMPYTERDFNRYIKHSGHFILKNDKTSLGKYRTYNGKSLYTVIAIKNI